MNTPTLHHITASIIETDEWGVSSHPYRGVAFLDPVTGNWCDLRTGCVIAYCLGDEVIIRNQRPVRDAWQPGLAARLPLRVRAPKSTAIAAFAAANNHGSEAAA